MEIPWRLGVIYYQYLVATATNFHILYRGNMKVADSY